MSTRSTRYRVHDPELRRLVSQTKNIDIAIRRGVPRTTAIYWANSAKENTKVKSCAEVLLEEEIKKLNKELEKQRAKNMFLRDIAQYMPQIKNTKRRVPTRIKKFIINKIEEYKKYATVAELLRLSCLHYSTYSRWRSDLIGCEVTNNGLCGKRKPNQLTGDEAVQILKLSVSKKYQHYSLTALWKYSIRNGLVMCSIETWFKYINMFGVRRLEARKKKKMYEVGVRALKPNQVWHLDLSYFKLNDGTNVYLQVIIDNYSRYIVNWNLFTTKEAHNTFSLLKGAKAKLSKSSSTEVYMDSGTENKNKTVDKVFYGKNLKRVYAKVDVKYSNSMVESFFRSIKNNHIYKHSFENAEKLKKEIGFYINEHNHFIPHNAFDFQTPEEIYKGSWSDEKTANLKREQLEARKKRKEHNLRFQACESCVA
tara:strand:+ start:1155 stop:2426 length:1272 start_codon:yes stop_codon:yes gene_type:complete